MNSAAAATTAMLNTVKTRMRRDLAPAAAVGAHTTGPLDLGIKWAGCCDFRQDVEVAENDVVACGVMVVSEDSGGNC